MGARGLGPPIHLLPLFSLSPHFPPSTSSPPPPPLQDNLLLAGVTVHLLLNLVLLAQVRSAWGGRH